VILFSIPHLILGTELITALSIILTDKLASASQQAAKQLGISRAEFIRQAIAHELEYLRAEREQKAILQAFSAMKNDKQYLTELSELDENIASQLPKETKKWWK